MGQVKNNLLTKGFSGRIGDEIVFRQVGNRTLFAKRPRRSTLLSPSQSAQRELFSKAVLYAKTMMLDAATKSDYENRARLAGLSSAFSAALTDYLREPKIASIETEYYTGNVGDVIWVTALDDFKIQKMKVSILLADGTEVESGEALAENGRWKYVATSANPEVANTKLVVTATDRPGREAQLEKVLGDQQPIS